MAGAFVIMAMLSFVFAPQMASHADAQSHQGPDMATNMAGLGDAVNPAPTGDSSICSFVIIGDSLCSGITFLIFIPLHLSSWIFGEAGLLFNAAIRYTIIDVTANVTALTGINVAWAVIRDLINFSFIFILLYAGIQMILNGGGNMKKVIPTIVIAAILINFSLFFAKVIIDTSNAVTLQLYSSIVASCDPKDAANLDNTNLSGCFNNALGITTLYQTTNTSTGAATVNDNAIKGLQNDFGKAAIISVGGSIFLLIATFVFLAVAIMLLVRFVIIIILFIFSPLMVIGGVLPGIGKQTNKWWGEMTDQAIFPAVFMLLVWVILRILSGAAFLGIGNQTAQTVGAGGTSTVSVVANFVIIISFMIMALTLSKSFSKHGGKLATETAGKIMGGGGGYIGRRTIGSASRSLADNEKLKQKASEKGFGGSMARLALRGGQKGAAASYDARGISGVSSTLGAGKATGKGGYDAYIKDKAKKHEDFVKSLAPSEILAEQTKVERTDAEKELTSAREARERARLDNDQAGVKAAEDRMARAQERIKNADLVVGAGDKEVKDRGAKLETEKGKRLKDIDQARDLKGKETKRKELNDEITTVVEDSQKKIKETRKTMGDAISAEEKELATKKEELGKAVLDETKKALETDIAEKEKSITTKREEMEKAVESIQEAMDLKVEQNKNEIKGINKDLEEIQKEKDDVGALYAREKESLGKVKGAADVRKEGYIETIAGGPYQEDFLYGSSNRVGFIGMVKRQNKQAIANMRKGKKSVDDRLKEILKEEGELKDKEETSTASTTGSAPGGGTPPGNTPPTTGGTSPTP